MICENCGLSPTEFLCQHKEENNFPTKSFSLCRKCYVRDNHSLIVVGREPDSKCFICNKTPNEHRLCDCDVSEKIADFEIGLQQLSLDWRNGFYTYGEYQQKIKDLILEAVN